MPLYIIFDYPARIDIYLPGATLVRRHTSFDLSSSVPLKVNTHHQSLPPFPGISWQLYHDLFKDIGINRKKYILYKAIQIYCQLLYTYMLSQVCCSFILFIRWLFFCLLKASSLHTKLVKVYNHQKNFLLREYLSKRTLKRLKKFVSGINHILTIMVKILFSQKVWHYIQHLFCPFDRKMSIDDVFAASLHIIIIFFLHNKR